MSMLIVGLFVWLFSSSQQQVTQTFHITVHAMETPITAPITGTLTSVYVQPQQNVSYSAPLMVIEENRELDQANADTVEKQREQLTNEIQLLDGLIAELTNQATLQSQQAETL